MTEQQFRQTTQQQFVGQFTEQRSLRPHGHATRSHRPSVGRAHGDKELPGSLRWQSALCHVVCARRSVATASIAEQRLSITRPDDWHVHLRDGPGLRSVVPLTAEHFERAVIMPNLQPPVTTTKMAPVTTTKTAPVTTTKTAPVTTTKTGSSFNPLMTLYLTDTTTEEEVYRAKEAGIVAFKLYPADSGVTSMTKVLGALKAMNEVGMLLLVHGEVTDSEVDMFDREAVFIQEKLIPLLDKLPSLKVVMEHITTKNAAEFVALAPDNVAASITPQHMLLNRNALFVGGLRPHNYCLPILKREVHREAVAAAATSGSKKFFLGTDSAPHPKAACGCAGIFSAPVAMGLYATVFDNAGALGKLEGFTSFNGPDFYGLPRNTGKMTLAKRPLKIPDSYVFGDATVVPMWAGQEVQWQVVADA
eukprot:gene3065-13084_t